MFFGLLAVGSWIPTAAGARPAPAFKWFIGGEEIKVNGARFCFFWNPPNKWTFVIIYMALN